VFLFGNISLPTTFPAPQLVAARRNVKHSRGRANPDEARNPRGFLPSFRVQNVAVKYIS
jgi:hypothetical protein